MKTNLGCDSNASEMMKGLKVPVRKSRRFEANEEEEELEEEEEEYLW